MYRVFNKVLQSDMGKTIVRKHAPLYYGQNLNPTSPHHQKVSMKNVKYMPMYPQLSMPDPERELQNNWFSTYISSSGN